MLKSIIVWIIPLVADVGIIQVYQPEPLTVPAGISCVVKLNSTIVFPKLSTPPLDCGTIEFL